jgi:hypothetical protein
LSAFPEKPATLDSEEIFIQSSGPLFLRVVKGLFFKVRMSFPELNLVLSFHLRCVSKSSLKETQRSTKSVSGRQNAMHFLGIACIVVNNASIWKGSN